MKKVILFLLISGGAFSQRNGLIDADTTKRPKSGLSALAFNNGSLRIVRNSGSSIGVGLLSGTQTWTGLNSFGGSSSLSSGTANIFSLTPTISQSGTAAYRGIFVSPFEQATGSGSKLLLDLGTNSAANGGGTHTSRFSVANDGSFISSYGRVFNTGNWFLGSSPVDAGYRLDVNGTARVQGNHFITNGYLSTNNTTANTAALFVINASPASGNWGHNASFGGGNGSLKVFTHNSGAKSFANWANWSITNSRWETETTTTVGSTRQEFGIDGSISFLTQPATAVTTGQALNYNNSLTIRGNGNILVNTVTDEATSQLTISSTTKGFLPPRMTQTQRNAIASPATGLTLYCTDCTATDSSTGVMQTYNGSTWKNNW